MAAYLGIDLGTSGARAIAIDGDGEIQSSGKSPFQDKADGRDPAGWWRAVSTSVKQALAGIEGIPVKAVCVSATSGTVLAIDGDGAPVSRSFMYNDPCPDEAILAAVKGVAPDWSPARGGAGGLSCALALKGLKPARIGHQSDWINFQLTGRWLSDAGNALKTGYDPMAGAWPDWLSEAGLERHLLPEVFAVGSRMGVLSAQAAEAFGLSAETAVIAGTTDGCASFLATGASEPGDAVSALGTTLTLKLMSDQPVFAPEFGIYSHRIGDFWLAGGASNSGGGALLKHFTADQMVALSEQIDPDVESGLDYYPLAGVGERFPVADPTFEGRVTPRPAEDAAFLHGLLDGIASVEAQAYSKLAEAGAPAPKRVYSVGGGAQNPVWTVIRQRKLGVPFEVPRSVEAAYGSALLALRGVAR